MGSTPPPIPNLSGRMSNHPMQGSKCCHGKGCQKRVVRASLNFCLRPFCKITESYLMSNFNSKLQSARWSQISTGCRPVGGEAATAQDGRHDETMAGTSARPRARVLWLFSSQQEGVASRGLELPHDCTTTSLCASNSTLDNNSIQHSLNDRALHARSRASCVCARGTLHKQDAATRPATTLSRATRQQQHNTEARAQQYQHLRARSLTEPSKDPKSR